MRVILTSYGTLGDVQPLLALAAELRRGEHRVVFALPSRLIPYTQRLGYDSVELGPDLFDELDRLACAEEGKQPTADEAGKLAAILLKSVPQYLRTLVSLCANADLLVSAELMLLGRVVHDLIGIPFVSVPICHPGYEAMTPNGPGTPVSSLLEFCNMFRSQLGLTPTTAHEAGVSPQLTLFAHSSVVCPRSPDWPAHYHAPGFFYLDERDWMPDRGLEAFLRAGPPPVVITLGSERLDNPALLNELFLTAIQAVGCRAVVQHGWMGLAKGVPLPEGVYTIDYVPYEWLFARAACVIHHCGAGTTSCVLRSGVPAVAVPRHSEQLAWAKRAHRLGCIGGIVPFSELDCSRLSAVIRTTLANPQYRTAAAAVGEQIRTERGVQVARALIEEFAKPLLPRKNQTLAQKWRYRGFLLRTACLRTGLRLFPNAVSKLGIG